MIDELIKKIREDKENRDRFENIFIERQVAARTVLLNEGEIASYIHFIKRGCLRECFNKDGKDITFQFFFEGQPVASIDSVMNSTPCLFSIVTIEPSTILSVKKQDFEMLLSTYPELKDKFQSFIFQRFSNYARLCLSRIKDTPQERYEDLVKNQPNIIKRIPQHYIASYLGITPVSLSRIRNRK